MYCTEYSVTLKLPVESHRGGRPTHRSGPSIVSSSTGSYGRYRRYHKPPKLTRVGTKRCSPKCAPTSKPRETQAGTPSSFKPRPRRQHVTSHLHSAGCGGDVVFLQLRHLNEARRREPLPSAVVATRRGQYAQHCCPTTPCSETHMRVSMHVIDAAVQTMRPAVKNCVIFAGLSPCETRVRSLASSCNGHKVLRCMCA